MAAGVVVSVEEALAAAEVLVVGAADGLAAAGASAVAARRVVGKGVEKWSRPSRLKR